MTAPTPPVQLLGSSVLLSGPAVVHAFNLLERGINDAQRRDGISPPATVREMQAALRVARELVMSLSGTALHAGAGHGDRPGGGVAQRLNRSSEELATRDVAEMLGESPRTVRRKAASLGGRINNGRLAFPRGHIEAYIAERRSA